MEDVTYDELVAQLRESKEEEEALTQLCHRQADILSKVALALHGGPLEDGLWSHHDLGELAEQKMRELQHALMAIDGVYG